MLLQRNTGYVLNQKEYLSVVPPASMVDRSRNANNGVFSNVAWVTMPNGLRVMNFNGTDSYVEIADSPSMRMDRGGTIKVWVYARGVGETSGRIIHKGTDISGTNGFYLAVSTSNTLIFKLNAGTDLVSSANALPYGAWMHVVVRFSPTGRTIYVNGVNVTNTGGTETALPPNIAGIVRIGNNTVATDRTFDGYINGVEMLNRVWTDEELLRNFNAERYLYGV